MSHVGLPSVMSSLCSPGAKGCTGLCPCGSTGAAGHQLGSLGDCWCCRGGFVSVPPHLWTPSSPWTIFVIFPPKPSYLAGRSSIRRPPTSMTRRTCPGLSTASMRSGGCPWPGPRAKAVVMVHIHAHEPFGGATPKARVTASGVAEASGGRSK